MSNPDSIPDIVIIGAGFGGLGMAIQLKKAGIDNFVVLEKAASVGGTWRDNTYPGAACDVQSHLYSFSFEPKHDWSRKYGMQPEILSYLEHCTDKYGIRQHIRFHSEVSGASFDENRGNWEIQLANADILSARILITACGQLNQPIIPAINGLESFAGKVFHSARWDHSYDLRDKSVAVIGTGASAIQFVPEIVDKVSRLTLFQRSGAWVIHKPDRPFSRVERWLLSRFPLLDRLYRASIYWNYESRALAFTRFGFLLNIFKPQVAKRLRKHVADPDKCRKLYPDYPVGCKRLLISNDWYPAVGRDNVELITEELQHIDSQAMVTRDGKRHPVDAIIFGTGFKATDFLAPMTITGLAGVELNQAWRDGAEAYKGISVSGFPNLFMLYGPNTNLGHNSIVFMLESQIHYVMQCVRMLQDPGLHFMNVKSAPQKTYNDGVQAKLKSSVWQSGCTSWYQTASGKNTVNWPGFTFRYRMITRKLDLQDYELRPNPAMGN